MAIRKKEIYLPPSGASTWTTCTMQPWMIFDNAEILPPKEDTDASSDGVLAHAYAEALLNGTQPPKAPKKIRDNATDYVNFVNSLSEGGEELMRGVELKVPPFYAPHRNAYIDFLSVVRVVDTLLINVADYKNGVWPVRIDRNKQAAIYGRSVVPYVLEELTKQRLDLSDFSIVFNLYVYQPNCRGEDDDDNPIRGPWTLRLEDLIAWTNEEIGDVAVRIQKRSPDLVFDANDDNCHFCQARTICPARNQELFGDSESEAELVPVTTPALDPSLLPKEKILSMLPHCDAVIAFCKQVKNHARHMAEIGVLTESDGYKLVKGKGSRDWKDEEIAAATLQVALTEDEIYPPRELVSPAKAEKLLKEQGIGKKVLDTLVERTEGRPLLVPVSDPREAISGSTLSDEELVALLDDEVGPVRPVSLREYAETAE